LSIAILITAFISPAQAVYYSYDRLNRLIGVVYDDGTDLAYTYDAAGNLLSVIGGTAQVRPNPFSFPSKTNVAVATLIQSDPATISGIDFPAPISVTNGQYCISSAANCACNIAAFTSAAGNILNGQSVCVRHMSAATVSTTTTTTLTVGTAVNPFSTTFQSTTESVIPTVPDPPTNVLAIAGNAQAGVSFVPPANTGGSAISGYTVSSHPAGGTDSNAGSTSISHTVVGLTNGIAYNFTVTATNAVGTSANSVPSNSVTPVGPPGAPTGVIATANIFSQVIVRFVAPGNNGGSPITGYSVSSNPAGGVDSNAGGLATMHTIVGLTIGTSYTFTVTATNSLGTGPPSAPSNAVTTIAPPEMVFVPLMPCRIMDTRNAVTGSGVQGPILGDNVYHIPGFITAGSNWGQYGGNGSADCGLANPPGADIHAVAIVITILNPNFDAFLGVSDVNNLSMVLSNVALNFSHGQGLSTMYIVQQTQIGPNNIYFALPAGLSAQLIFDVVGYYVVSDATALQCTTQASAPVVIGAGSTGSAISPACSAGYALTSGSCDSTSFSMKLTSDKASGSNTTWTCSANNLGGSSANLTATVNCCRVPGK